MTYTPQPVQIQFVPYRSFIEMTQKLPRLAAGNQLYPKRSPERLPNDERAVYKGWVSTSKPCYTDRVSIYTAGNVTDGNKQLFFHFYPGEKPKDIKAAVARFPKLLRSCFPKANWADLHAITLGGYVVGAGNFDRMTGVLRDLGIPTSSFRYKFEPAKPWPADRDKNIGLKRIIDPGVQGWQVQQTVANEAALGDIFKYTIDPRHRMIFPEAAAH